METRYKNAKISVEIETFGNGAAVEVHVDGEKILDLYDSHALCTTTRSAMDLGFKCGRDYIDGKVEASGAV